MSLVVAAMVRIEEITIIPTAGVAQAGHSSRLCDIFMPEERRSEASVAHAVCITVMQEYDHRVKCGGAAASPSGSVRTWPR
jgi:hypothetical protein